MKFVQRGGKVLWPGSTYDYNLESFVLSPKGHEAKPAMLAKRQPPRRRAEPKLKKDRHQ
jgi:hypothetical protein